MIADNKLVPRYLGVHPTLRPLPGKIPLGLYIRVLAVGYSKDGVKQTATRYFYKGKWSSQAVKAAMRCARGIGKNHCRIKLAEFTASGIVAYGNFNFLTILSPAYGLLTIDPDREMTRLTGTAKNWPFLKERIPVRVGTKTVMWGGPAPKDSKGKYASWTHIKIIMRKRLKDIQEGRRRDD